MLKKFFINFLFLLSIKNTTNNKLQEIFIYKKNKTQNNTQPKTEPLSNPHLAVPRQHINVKRIYVECHSEVTALSPKKEKEEWHF